MPSPPSPRSAVSPPGGSPSLGAKRRARRQTIGVLVDWLMDGYQNLLFAGMADAARELDVNLLCLAGGVLGSPQRHGAERNFIYELAPRDRLDGLVLLSGTLGNHLGPIELGRFCERFAPLPLVSVAVPVPGMSTVVVQDAEGMRQAVRHLTKAHGYRRIAFIGGPIVNDEAQRRFKAYRDVLAESGIAFDENLVTPGDFQFEAGAEAVRLLLDDRRVTFDAVVAVNDHMALGAVHELHRRNFQVPAQVAIVGFDDIDEARFATPPLTTVRQPLYQQGARALKILLDQTSGRPVGTTFHMKTELVIRESCGCIGRHHDPDTDASLLSVAWRDDTLEQRLASRREEVCRQMAQHVGPAQAVLPAGWEGALVDSWIADLNRDQSAAGGDFVAALQRSVRHADDVAAVDAACWQEVITAMRRLLSPLFTDHESRRQRAEDLWHQAREEIATLSERSQARQRLRLDGWARTLSETGEALMGAVDTSTLVTALAQKLPRWGIPGAYLCLFEREGAFNRNNEITTNQTRLLLAYDQVSARADGIPAPTDVAFSDRQLLPAEHWPAHRRWTIVVEPLLMLGQRLGYVMLEVGPRHGAIYESLRKQISGAVNSVQLIEQSLKEAEGRMQGLKLEAIGTLAAGVAHEINTPIQYLGDSVAFMKEALEGYQRAVAAYRRTLSSIGATGMSPSPEEAAQVIDDEEDLAYLDTEAPNAAIRCGEGIRRVAEIVNAMKEFSRADRRTAVEADINRALKNTLEVARSQYREWADVNLELGNLPLVRCFIGELNQVFLNLIINAAHAIEDTVRRTQKRGTLTLRSSVIGNDVVVEIEDTGGGIPEAIAEKIFDPFFTTKAVGRGSGQGLAIARAAVVQHHGGTLTFSSQAGVGTVFRVGLPITGGVKDKPRPNADSPT